MRGGIARDQRSVLFGGARRRRITFWLVLIGAVAAIAGGKVAVAKAQEPAKGKIGFAPAPPVDDGFGLLGVLPPVILWERSVPLGLPFEHGRLRNGVRLPPEGPDWFTWDFPLRQSPNRGWRRWGTDAVLRTTLAVLRQYRTADAGAPRVGIGDLSRPRGGAFGPRFGGLGHASHQNGLDVDVLYPRRDGLEGPAWTPRLVDEPRAQALVDLFVQQGAQKVFVGPRLDLDGPPRVVIPLIHHDDHMHVRIPPPPV